MSLVPDSSSAPEIFTQVILGLSVPGLVLTTVLLTLYGYAAWNPLSRRYLDRVMSLSALHLAHATHHLSLCSGILSTIGALVAFNGGWCALVAFISNVRPLALWSSCGTIYDTCQQLCLVFSAGMFFSIAINLPLVLVFNVNGRKMEKYYVIGIILIGIVSNVAQYVSGKLQWDETCWFGSRDPSATLRWLVGVQIVWVLLASLGEVISFTIILGYLVVYRLVPEDSPTSHPSTSSHRPGSTILRFRYIILRIGLYPLVACILNISTTVIEFCMFQNPQQKIETSQELEPNLRLDLANLAIYVGRPLIYGLLAATDPSFIRALRALRHPQNESETPSQIRTRGLVMSTIIYLPPDEISINEPDKADAPGSSLEAQMRRDETFTTFAPDTNPEMGRVPPVCDGNGTPAPIDVVSHI
ncbi:hypothetical protein C8R45DRAFT_985832 [Mycena sanguinolenta]|nr:hypothetical protein C8R45DRAFT_985832 [Mycena sanguinolenta]